MDYETYCETYYKKHAVCPSCHSKYYEETLVGYTIIDEHSKDGNHIHCACGWKGIVHDLVEE